MPSDLRVHVLPCLFEPGELRGGVAVVIDLLRASTTIVHALAAGAGAVIPCLEVDHARRASANFRREEIVLGGEREGVLIEGFDLDNSPLKYTKETVGGKTVIFTTTNGTRALLRCREADEILVGSLVNLAALAERLVSQTRPVHLVCAGTRGQISGEDVLCAGALAVRLKASWGIDDVPDDPARIAVDYFEAHATDDESLLRGVRDGLGGRDLVELGYEDDIRRAATRDLFHVIPRFDPETGRIERR